jgi:RimJ/RimL family protein N-acetyltransferase
LTSCTFSAANYHAAETLRNGKRVLVRALKPEDHDAFIAAAGGLTAQSLRRRFFGEKRRFTAAEESFFLNPDFTSHVALIAIVEEGDRPVIAGGARYVVVKPGQAELAFAVADRFQGQGIGTTLMHHLATIAREGGVRELIAEVLPENVAMLKVFKRSGLSHWTETVSGAVHVTLQLAPPPAGQSISS